MGVNPGQVPYHLQVWKFNIKKSWKLLREKFGSCDIRMLSKLNMIEQKLYIAGKLLLVLILFSKTECLASASSIRWTTVVWDSDN